VHRGVELARSSGRPLWRRIGPSFGRSGRGFCFRWHADCLLILPVVGIMADAFEHVGVVDTGHIRDFWFERLVSHALSVPGGGRSMP
jgi:hypothetical protein